MMGEPAPDDGRFYAEGRLVRRAPLTKREGEPARVSITLGFPVCELTDYVPESVAETIAQALNTHFGILVEP